MSWLKAQALESILYIVVTPEVSHALMSSLKDAAPELQKESHQPPEQNNSDMSVTPEVSQVEMWPYVASAAVASASHAATAVLIVVSSATKGVAVGAAVVGAGVAVGSDVGAGVGAGVDVGASVKVGAGVDVGANDGRRVGQGVQYVGANVGGSQAATRPEAISTPTTCRAKHLAEPSARLPRRGTA